MDPTIKDLVACRLRLAKAVDDGQFSQDAYEKCREELVNAMGTFKMMREFVLCVRNLSLKVSMKT